MKRKSLSTQITLWTALIILVTAGIVVSYSVFSMRRNAMELAKENIHSLSHQAAHQIEQKIFKTIDTLNTMAQLLGQVRDNDSPLDIPRYEAARLMRSILEENVDFQAAFICWEPEEYDFLDAGYANEPGHDASGRFAPLWRRDQEGHITLHPLLASPTYSPDGQPGIWYSESHKNEFFISESFFDQQTQELIATVAVPVVNNDTFLGVVGVDLNLSLFFKRIETACDLGKEMQVDIIDSAGMVIGSSDHPELIGLPVEELYRKDSYLLPHVQSGAHFVGIDKGNLYHVSEIDFAANSSKWVMSAIVPIETITKDISSLMWQQIAIIAAIMVVLIILTLAGTRFIIQKPLSLLLKEVHRVSQGDLNHKVKMVRNDEIGLIGDAFNSMRIKLKKVLKALQSHQKELEQKVKRRTTALQMKNKLIEKSRVRLKNALDEISSLINEVVQQGGDLDASFKHPELKKCWQVLKCSQEECPCFGKEPMRCWQENGTLCRNEHHAGFEDKYHMCGKCMFFQNTTNDPIYQIGEHFNNMIFILKKNNEKLAHTNQQLYQAQKLESVGQLAAGIAHEINTPTQYVGSNIEFLQEAFDDIRELVAKFITLLEAEKKQTVTPELISEMEETLQEVEWEYLIEEIPETISQSQDGVKRVTSIVRAMKEFSHPGSKEKEPADLNHIIETTVTVARNEWKYVSNVETDLDPDLPSVPLLTDETGQVILNLLVNAAHAVAAKLGENPEGEKGVISITTSHDDGWAEVRITDSGTGIPEKARGRIFDPFFTTKKVGKGTGQGLAIAHDVITQKHGGTLTFETEMGEGTTFIIRLPVEAQKK